MCASCLDFFRDRTTHLLQDNELEGPAHMTMDSLIAHAESTSSTLFYQLLSLLDVSSEALSHAASHLGVAHSLAILLRALPYHASKGRMVIPAEITAKHGVSQEDVFRRGPRAEGIDNAVFEFATVANDHLLTAREMFKETGGKVPQAGMPVFASGVSDFHDLWGRLLTEARAGLRRVVSGAVRAGEFRCVRGVAAGARVEAAVARLA